MSDICDKIKHCLTANGFGDRIGRDYGTPAHSCGLPHVEAVTVQPSFSPVDGDHTVRVTAEDVSSWVLVYPSNFHDWRLHRRIAYATPEAMLDGVRRLADKPKGCW